MVKTFDLSPKIERFMVEKGKYNVGKYRQQKENRSMS